MEMHDFSYTGIIIGAELTIPDRPTGLCVYFHNSSVDSRYMFRVFLEFVSVSFKGSEVIMKGEG